MNQELLNELRQISDEEQGYLKGQVDVDRGIYMEPETHMDRLQAADREW